MSRHVTIEDIARHAGVSVATVDRVLNDRRPVRADTAKRVVEAAEALNYHATPLLRRRADALTPKMRFGFLLQKRSKPFYQALAGALEAETAANATIRGSQQTAFVEELSPGAIVDQMRRFGETADALGIVAIDHPHIADEIERLSKSGIPTFSLLSGLSAPSIAGHVGVDGRKAGRTAGWAIERCAREPGPVGVLIGSNRYHGHEDREIGFRGYFRGRGQAFEIMESVSYLDDDAGAYGTMLDLLSKNPGAVGYYIIGGGAGGAVRALREEHIGKDVALVCHELDAFSRDALIDGTVDMVIDTPIRQVARAAIAGLVHAAGRGAGPVGQSIIPFEVYVSENI